MPRYLSLGAMAVWPLLVGAALDVVDFALGDIAQGLAWSTGGALGVLTASAPTTLACLFLRARRVRWFILAGFVVGAMIGGAIAAWAFMPSVDPLAAPIYLLVGQIVFLGAVATGFLFWLIRRPDRNTPANPPTPAP